MTAKRILASHNRKKIPKTTSVGHNYVYKYMSIYVHRYEDKYMYLSNGNVKLRCFDKG